MPTPLLETKLYAPRGRGTSVARPRLMERLDRPDSTLVLVSAPAGFGKTTLLTQWLRPETPEGPSVAWVSLDSGDNDPARFWAYVVAALRTALQQVAPALGARELELLRSPDTPSAVRLLTPLLNDLDALGHDVVLALDDYHVIDGAEVHEGVSFLLDHAPPSLHLLIASRVDPPLSLARLRARGQLTEVRVADLRFTAEEAAEYLNGPMGLSLSPAQVAALEGRTEGWIAALQLAGLSLQGRADAAGFIGAFTGDDRYIVDYLVEEVLDRQPDHVARFLLQTSLLSRLTGPLCDAVTGQAGGRAALESLERANLFVVPLDDHRRWYRYHHLFADVLRARLLAEQSELVPVLHRRAGDWYEAHGLRSEAIHHALAAGDHGRAAELIERTIPAARRDRTDAALRAWLDQLPEEVVRVRPVLSLAYAGALLSTGRVEGVAEHLANVERGMAARDDVTVVVDEELYRSLPGWVALYRAAHALLLGDTSTTVTFAHDGLDLLDDDDHIGHAAGSAMLGLASWAQGDLEAAHAAYTRCQQTFHDAGYRSDILGCAITLADIRITQGRLRDAMRTYQEALRLAGGPPAASDGELRGTVDMYVGMAELHREHNDLAEAARLLERARALGEHAGLPQSRYRWHVAMARIRQVEGDLDAASVHLDEAELSFDTDFGPEVRPIMALRARLWLVQGRVGDALTWASAHGVSADGAVSYRREYEHVTLARALLAQFVRTRDEAVFVEATQLLRRLLLAAEDGGRTGTVVEILMLQAVTCHHHGEHAEALGHLERALAIAEPEGYVRIFLDEGPAMLELMRSAAAAGIATAYVRSLLPGAGPPAGRDDRALVEPLSARERDVLRLLMTELTGPDIARELVLSLNTVRSHTKRIFAKLGVNNRRAAVRRAQELDLLARNDQR